MIVLSWSLVVLGAGLLAIGLAASQTGLLVAASVVAVLAIVPMVVAVRGAGVEQARSGEPPTTGRGRSHPRRGRSGGSTGG